MSRTLSGLIDDVRRKFPESPWQQGFAQWSREAAELEAAVAAKEAEIERLRAAMKGVRPYLWPGESLPGSTASGFEYVFCVACGCVPEAGQAHDKDCSVMVFDAALRGEEKA